MKQLYLEAGIELGELTQKRNYIMSSESDLVEQIVGQFKLNRKLRRIQRKRIKIGFL